MPIDDTSTHQPEPTQSEGFSEKESLNCVLRTAKVWQSQNHELIFQASPWGPASRTLNVRKVFVCCDVKQSSFGLKLQVEKPDFQVLTTNPLITLLRKHCKGATIAVIYKDLSNGDLWIPLYRDRQEANPWCLLMNKSRPPNFALISPDNTVLVRHGMKGTFTKKRSLEDRPNFLSTEAFRPIFTELIETLAETHGSTEASVENTVTPEESSREEPTQGELTPLQRQLLSKLKRRLKTAGKAHDKQKSKLPSATEATKSSQMATLLQSYAYLVKPGDIVLKLEPGLTGLAETIEIELDPEQSLGANIEAHFKQSKKLEKARRLGTKLQKTQTQELAALKQAIENLQQESLAYPQIEAIAKRFQIPLANPDDKTSQSSSQRNMDSVASPFRTFQSQTGHTILVGKGPKENDELTKSAKANDLWLHAAGVAGSHVIVPVKGELKQGIPPQLLKEAAILALHYSKFKDDLAGETYVAQRSQIKKQKGMPPGLWNVERCKTMFFRYTNEELQQILSTKSF